MHACMRISLHVCMDVNIWSSKSDCYFAASLTALIVATRLQGLGYSALSFMLRVFCVLGF